MQKALVQAWRGGPVSKLWRSYNNSLEKNPLVTGGVTSGVLWGAGDLLAQRIALKKGESYTPDLKRTAQNSIFGGSVIGPLGSLWYAWLERMALSFGAPGTLAFLAAKLAADSTLWNAFFIASFFLWGELVVEQKGSLDTYTAKMAEDFVPTFTAEAIAWPPIMALIFCKLPVSQHLLAVNLVTVLDVAFLAAVSAGALNISSITDQVKAVQKRWMGGEDQMRKGVVGKGKSKQPRKRHQQPTAQQKQKERAGVPNTLLNPQDLHGTGLVGMTPENLWQWVSLFQGQPLGSGGSMPALASMHNSRSAGKGKQRRQSQSGVQEGKAK